MVLAPFAANGSTVPTVSHLPEINRWAYKFRITRTNSYGSGINDILITVKDQYGNTLHSFTNSGYGNFDTGYVVPTAKNGKAYSVTFAAANTCSSSGFTMTVYASYEGSNHQIATKTITSGAAASTSYVSYASPIALLLTPNYGRKDIVTSTRWILTNTSGSMSGSSLSVRGLDKTTVVGTDSPGGVVSFDRTLNHADTLVGRYAISFSAASCGNYVGSIKVYAIINGQTYGVKTISLNFSGTVSYNHDMEYKYI